MNTKLRSWRTIGTLLVLLSFGFGELQAAPGNGKGGGNKGGASHSGEHQAKGPKTTRKSLAPEAALAEHDKLSAKLAGLLAPGTDLQLAAAGFKNLGQFVAAVHVSYNLGIPFDQLKTEMVDSGASLGQAIHKLLPKVDAEAEEEEGEEQAGEDLS